MRKRQEAELEVTEMTMWRLSLEEMTIGLEEECWFAVVTPAGNNQRWRKNSIRLNAYIIKPSFPFVTFEIIIFGSLILVLINRCKKLKTLFRLFFFSKKSHSPSSQHNIQAQHPLKEEAGYYFGQIILQMYFVRLSGDCWEGKKKEKPTYIWVNRAFPDGEDPQYPWRLIISTVLVLGLQHLWHLIDLRNVSVKSAGN